LKAGNPKGSRPFLRAGLVLTMVSVFLAYGWALSRNDVFSVTSSALQVRNSPSNTAPSVFVLDKGAHVFSLGQERSSEEIQWMKIAFLHRPAGGIFLERVEGWISNQVRGDPPSIRPENLLAESLAVRCLYKWKIQSLFRRWTRESQLLMSVKAFMPLAPDKTVHVFFMFLLSQAVFLCLVLGTGLSQFAAVLTTLLVTNLLGLVNEFLDLSTDMGNFERMDLAANAIGSAGLLVPVTAKFVCGRLRNLWMAKGPLNP
jgi:hypothetical protein